VSLLVGAQALLYPSLAEGYGLPVAEALALGVPVVCSDLSELRELGQNVPEYLDPQNEQAWADVVFEYTKPASTLRTAQLRRLANWRPPRWEEHFAIVQPLIDGLARDCTRQREHSMRVICANDVMSGAGPRGSRGAGPAARGK
jgi:hypothetical protein